MLKIVRYTFFALCGSAGLLAFATAASAEHVWGNSAGAYHWARTSNPFTVLLGDNVSSVWDSYLRSASTDWSASEVLDTSVVAGKGGSNCYAQQGRVEVCARKYGRNGWLGVAQIYVSGNHITRGIVKMNDTYFNTATYNKPSWRHMVMCQEIGHIFGLGHQDEEFDNSNLGSCMDYTDNPARDDGAGDNLHPNEHDYALLEEIYEHLDSSTTLASASTASSRRQGLAGMLDSLPFDISVPGITGEVTLGDDPRQWGFEIARSANGYASVFSKKINGEQVLTHVFWAEPREHGHN